MSKNKTVMVCVRMPVDLNERLLEEVEFRRLTTTHNGFYKKGAVIREILEEYFNTTDTNND